MNPTSITALGPETVAALTDALFDENFERVHAPWRKLFGTAPFHWREGLSYEQRSALSYERLRLVNASLGSVDALVDDIHALTALHEWAAPVDSGLVTAAGIHYNLFLGSVLDQDPADERTGHLAALLSMRRTGTFLCTELGHGNGAVRLETTATFDPSTGGFRLHTPTTAAQKFMPNTGSVGGHKSAVVAARLIVGDRDEGVFLFLTPLHDEEGKPLTGITVRRLPEKTGSPLDHCLTSFDRFPLPRYALLEGEHGRLRPDGTLAAATGNRRKRFLHAIRRVTEGKLCMAAASLGGARSALATALRYGHTRHTVGMTPGRSLPLSAYRSHHARLLDALATLYAATLWHRRVVRRWAAHEAADREECERLAAVAKGWITWQVRDIVTECRERCGAQGLFRINGMADHSAINEGAITAEGDNLVVWAKAGGEMAIGHSAPPASAVPPGDRRLDQPGFLQDLLADTERIWHRRAGERLRGGPARDPLARWNTAADAALELVAAYARRQAAASLLAAAEHTEDDRARQVLFLLHRLFALRAVAVHSGDLLAEERMTSGQVRALHGAAEAVLDELAPLAPSLAGTLAVSEDILLTYPIAREDHVTAFADAAREEPA
ncbi:acyl-CoA dehydrogenase [Streptomyces sp. NPDC018031]|uniref:acyl-CoA dehydrogenase family protein n=1 Tax=Streptomyces sp. NPDC018031 TaxID=3365033 RepID=UPI0037A87FA9